MAFLKTKLVNDWLTGKAVVSGPAKLCFESGKMITYLLGSPDRKTWTEDRPPDSGNGSSSRHVLKQKMSFAIVYCCSGPGSNVPVLTNHTVHAYCTYEFTGDFWSTKNKWKAKMYEIWALFEHLFKVLSIYLQSSIRNQIKVKGRIRIRIKATSRIRIRISDKHGPDPPTL
jgi:hypothetical protein